MRTRAPQFFARLLAELVDGASVLVAGAATLIAGLMLTAAMGAGAGDARIISSVKAPDSSPSVGASAIDRSTAATAPASPPAPAFPVPPPSPEPSAEPTSPIVASSFRSGGRSYAGIEARQGTTFLAPFEGTVEVRLYQFINNEVRVGSNVPSLPFFPYVTLTSADRQLIFRPGALGIDVQMIARDAQRVGVGAPLFRTIGGGRSSWATFYDRSVPFQVVASLQAGPGGRELDPLIGYLTD